MLGSVPFAFNVIYASVKRVQKEIKPVIWVYGGIAVIMLVLGYLFMTMFGVVGVGVAWVVGNGVVAGGVGVKTGRHIFKLKESTSSENEFEEGVERWLRQKQ